ncbi:MAG: zf-HC2 domain-containing protein [Hydrogenophaga sp.]|jgi:hypothetical protein|nr:zf-HC2 domain-containing protein [Hydrogenophaga sp.]
MNIFHSCERAAELMSQALDEPLDLADQMRLRIHLKMCGNCLEVEKQMGLLRSLTTQLGALALDDDAAPLNVEVR